LNKEIEKKLIEINADFYEDVFEEFSSSRQTPWKGWEKLWTICQLRGFSPKNIFDVGCGNARFLDFILGKCSGFKYLGIDNSSSFINTNRNDFNHDDFDFELVDLVGKFPESISKKTFDLILLIAVLHHIPGYSNRLDLLKRLASQLSKNGLLVVTYWNFLTDGSLAKKIFPWTKVSLSPKDVEAGDYLLNWGSGPEHLRYCHFFSNEEKERIINDLGSQLISSFQSDGRNSKLNTYHVFTTKG